MMKFTYLLVVLFFISLISSCVLAEDHPKKDVVERKLVIEKVTAKSILKENTRYSSDVTEKNTDGIVLAYVTPWNNHGYDIAKIFNNKFTHVSPVWYQLKMDGTSPLLTGGHDVAQGWLKEVKANGKTKILPRIILESEEFSALLSQQEAVFKLLVEECRKQKLDGLVLDGLVPIMSSPNSATYLHPLVKGLASALHTAGYEFVLVIPPKQGSRVVFTAADFEALEPFVDGFSLMSYDYSSSRSPGPTSPIDWVEDCVNEILSEASRKAGLGKKILMGLNFYGYDYAMHDGQKSGAIVGATYLEILQKHKPKISWDSHVKEHWFEYENKDGDHKVYFPSLKSIQERLQLAKQLGVSLSIWEIGQGLDYFYDLL